MAVPSPFIRLFSKGAIGQVIILNLLVGLGFLVGLWLSNHGFPYLAPLFGTAALLLPALNLALTTEQLTERRENLSTMLLWTVIFTVTLTPAATYVLDRVVLGSSIPIIDPLPPFVIWWVVSAFALVITILFKQVNPGIADTKLVAQDVREVGMLVGIFLVILLANFILYRFIPEADSYSYLIALDKLPTNPSVLTQESRPLFLMLINLLATLMELNPYWILKVVLPLMYGVVVATIYAIAHPLLKSPWLRILAALSPLLFPVILQEALISRPQSVVVLALVPALYLVAKISAEKTDIRQLYWLMGLVAVGVLGVKIHPLLFALTLLAVVGAVRLVWPLARRRPLDSLILAAVLALLLYPWVHSVRILADVWDFLKSFATTISAGHFEFWFIDSYHNADGIEAGWPGITALYYYGYNLGLFLPIIGLLVVVTRQFSRSVGLLRNNWPALVVLGFFFLIAEIAPRFRLAFLPDRAWLFVVLASTLFIPYLLQLLVERKNKILLSVLAMGAILSFLAGAGITSAKQGWITPAQYRAVTFMRQTPTNAVFISQGSNKVLIRYFAKRTSALPPASVFLESDPDALEKFLHSQEELHQASLQSWATNRDRMVEEYNQRIKEFGRYQTVSEGRAILNTLRRMIGASEESLRDPEVITHEFPTLIGPLYLIYSRDKFESLYGQRGWWRLFNFYGANVEKFSGKYPVVYDQDGTTIWEVRK